MIPASIQPWPPVRQGICRSWIVLALAALGCGPAGCKSTLDDVNIKDVYGPAGRHSKNLVEQAKRDIKGDPEAGLEEFNAARKLYDEQNYVAARKAFKKIVKKYKKKSEPIEEDALFYLAECDFQLARYPGAQDGYDELDRKSTRLNSSHGMSSRMPSSA